MTSVERPSVALHHEKPGIAPPSIGVWLPELPRRYIALSPSFSELLVTTSTWSSISAHVMLCSQKDWVLCGFVACAQIARTACFTSRAGEGWELKAVVASVVGGTSLRGGIGNMAGIFIGALTISVIENGLVVMRIPYFWTYVVFGLVILFSVLSSMYIEKRQREAHR